MCEDFTRERGRQAKSAKFSHFFLRTFSYEGNCKVRRELEHYNIDMIISVDYRVKSHIATSIDYDPNTDDSREFFAKVQNKMHWAAHGKTAAEII